MAQPRMTCRSVGVAAWIVALLLGLVMPAAAAVREVRVSVQNGRVHAGELTAGFYRLLELQPSAMPAGDGWIELGSDRGGAMLAALNSGLGEACRAAVDGNALVLRFDPEKFTADAAAVSRAMRVFAAIGDQPAARYGLHLPDKLDGGKPLVLLIHGVDSDHSVWGNMACLLHQSGFQTGFFVYPSDGPIADSSALLARNLHALKQQHPDLKLDIVAFSMGGLVARDYVEGDAYAGGVQRLVLCGTPNAGTSWARARFLLEWQEHYHLRKAHPDWDKTWTVSDGNGEAGPDMTPGSAFLTELNARPRRPGVAYTIVAGKQHPCRVKCAEWWECTATWVPDNTRHLWGFRHAYQACLDQAKEARGTSGETDGVVPLESARLAGVDDVVVVQADHTGLVCGTTPAAWETIRSRLGTK